MKAMIAALVVWSCLPAWAESQVKCVGFVTNVDHELRLTGELATSAFDHEYMRLDLAEFSLGADTHFIKEKGIGLVILNNDKGIASTAQVGFRQIPGTKVWSADLHQIHILDDGSQTTVEVSCYLEEP